jgi:uncharacterized protein YkwD
MVAGDPTAGTRHADPRRTAQTSSTLRNGPVDLQPCPALLGERIHRGRLAVLLTAATLILTGPAAVARASGGCRGANAKPTAENLNLIRSATLCLIDRARASARERPLHSNRALKAVAGSQVAGMIRFDYFSDVRPSGQTPGALIHATSYAARANLITGEDIGLGTGSLATPAQMVNSWLNSPAHREIMLDPAFRDIGVGVIAAVPSFFSGRQRGATYAIEFGARLR